MMRRLLRTREFLRDEASKIRRNSQFDRRAGRDSTQAWVTCHIPVVSYAHSWLTPTNFPRARARPAIARLLQDGLVVEPARIDQRSGALGLDKFPRPRPAGGPFAHLCTSMRFHCSKVA